MVHTPKTKRAAHKIEPEKQVVASPSHVGTTQSKTEETITVGPQRLPDSPFPKRVSLISYHRPGTPYRKVDPPGRETVSETAILDRTDDSFEIDSESERTLTEEPKTPKFQISRSEMPEGITKRRLVPAVLPFDSDGGKGPQTRTKSVVNPEKKSKVAEKPHIQPIKETVKVPVVKSQWSNPQ